MSKTVASQLIWLRPEPGERKPRLTRAAIARAALAIADAEGFEALSMRRVASELGAGVMTLYHYIKTKADLMALMDDALMGELLVPEGELPVGWQEALLAIARRTRDVFTRHRWALLSMRGVPPGPNALRHFEQSLTALAHAPFDEIDKLELLKLVDDFVMGHALRVGEVHAWSNGDPAVAKAVEEFGRREIATGRFPLTAALMKGADPRDAAKHVLWLTDERRFERALAALLSGALLQMRRRRREEAARPKVIRPKRPLRRT
jgi:AcrR family transcriptional regulator